MAVPAGLHAALPVSIAMVAPGSEDTWADVASPTLRRLVQNRLNKRASRQRKLQKEEETGVIRRPRGRPKTTPSSSSTKTTTTTTNAAPRPTCAKAATASMPSLPSRRLVQIRNNGTGAREITPKLYDFDALISKFIENLSSYVLSRLRNGDPSSDLLLHVTTLNSVRGIMYLMGMLDLPVVEMDNDQSVSQFNSVNPVIMARRRLLPASLQPTESQLAVVHHPWIDVYPFASFRDQLILHVEELEAEDHDLDGGSLCSDTLGLNEHAAAGLLLWGDPWDVHAWEVTEPFAKKWHWLLGGCDELVASTNYWRARRGEAAIQVPGMQVREPRVIGRILSEDEQDMQTGQSELPEAGR